MSALGNNDQSELMKTSEKVEVAPVILLPDQAEEIIFHEDSHTEKPPLLEKVPHFELERIIEALPLLNKHTELSGEKYFSFIANGNWALLIKTKLQGKEVVLKLFYGIGLSHKDASALTQDIGMTDQSVMNTKNLSTRDRSVSWHQSALESIGGIWSRFHYSPDQEENTRIKQQKIVESIQMEAGALKRGNELKNNYVPPVRAVLTYQGRPCGYIMPLIQGTFTSVENLVGQFPEAAEAREQLVQNGLVFDTSDNHNAAILEKFNQPVFFDISLRDVSELQKKS